MGHMADARGATHRQPREAVTIYRQMLPSSAFFGVGGATPGFDRGGLFVFEIGPSDLYIVNKAGASEKVRNLEGKMCMKKKAIRWNQHP